MIQGSWFIVSNDVQDLCMYQCPAGAHLDRDTQDTRLLLHEARKHIFITMHNYYYYYYYYFHHHYLHCVPLSDSLIKS